MDIVVKDYDILQKATQMTTWHPYFMNIAKAVAERSTCTRRKVGSVAVNNKRRILATGYNGAPRGIDHCTRETCIRVINQIPSGEQLNMCIASHAEQNLICQAATSGVDLTGCVVFCTHSPCLECTKLLINCGVKRVFYDEEYPDTSNGLIAHLWDQHAKNICPDIPTITGKNICIRLTNDYLKQFRQLCVLWLEGSKGISKPLW